MITDDLRESVKQHLEDSLRHTTANGDMTPNDIEVLLHCHTTPSPHSRLDAPAVSQTISLFLAEGMIEAYLNDNGDEGRYCTTDRGAALVRMLCATPWPVQTWIDPRTGEKA